MKTSLVDFLQDELKIGEIPAIALRRCEQNPSLLPMILWQYGLISLQELDRIFDWLEIAVTSDQLSVTMEKVRWEL